MPPNSKKFIKKKGKKFTKEGGTRPKPSEKIERNNIKKKTTKYRLWKSVVR